MSKANLLPTIEEIKKVLWYDKDSGLFLSRYSTKKRKPWQTTGSVESKGYLQIKIGKSLYMAHRLAWKYVTGDDPADFQIDHIDLNKINNAFFNLRLVTNKQNCENRKINVRNKTGHRGVYMKGNRFAAEICHNYVRIKIGVYTTLQEAVDAVTAKRKEIFSHAENF
jgi:hypothetical protein